MKGGRRRVHRSVSPRAGPPAEAGWQPERCACALSTQIRPANSKSADIASNITAIGEIERPRASATIARSKAAQFLRLGSASGRKPSAVHRFIIKYTRFVRLESITRLVCKPSPPRNPRKCGGARVAMFGFAGVALQLSRLFGFTGGAPATTRENPCFPVGRGRGLRQPGPPPSPAKANTVYPRALGYRAGGTVTGAGWHSAWTSPARRPPGPSSRPVPVP